MTEQEKYELILRAPMLQEEDFTLEEADFYFKPWEKHSPSDKAIFFRAWAQATGGMCHTLNTEFTAEELRITAETLKKLRASVDGNPFYEFDSYQAGSLLERIAFFAQERAAHE